MTEHQQSAIRIRNIGNSISFHRTWNFCSLLFQTWNSWYFVFIWTPNSNFFRFVLTQTRFFVFLLSELMCLFEQIYKFVNFIEPFKVFLKQNYKFVNFIEPFQVFVRTNLQVCKRYWNVSGVNLSKVKNLQVCKLYWTISGVAPNTDSAEGRESIVTVILATTLEPVW